MSMTRTYRKWSSMKARCYNQTHPAYAYYGGRGITVHETWRKSYKLFLAEMGEAPAGHWIDRIDNSKGYEPGNVRWVTPKQSASNRRPKSPHPGSLKHKAFLVGLPYHVVYQRVKHYGWTEQQALSVPVQKVGPMKRADKIQFGILPPGY